jgi:hypothetical protein
MILGLSFWKLIGAILTGLILSGVIIAMTIPHDTVAPKEEIKKEVGGMNYAYLLDSNTSQDMQLAIMIDMMMSFAPLLVLMSFVIFMLRIFVRTDYDGI